MPGKWVPGQVQGAPRAGSHQSSIKTNPNWNMGNTMLYSIYKQHILFTLLLKARKLIKSATSSQFINKIHIITKSNHRSKILQRCSHRICIFNSKSFSWFSKQQINFDQTMCHPFHGLFPHLAEMGTLPFVCWQFFNMYQCNTHMVSFKFFIDNDVNNNKCTLEPHYNTHFWAHSDISVIIKQPYNDGLIHRNYKQWEPCL